LERLLEAEIIRPSIIVSSVYLLCSGKNQSWLSESPVYEGYSRVLLPDNWCPAYPQEMP
jgi:hypothetical protein